MSRLFLILLLPFGFTAAQADPEILTFEDQIRPIFRTHCLDCHGAEVDKEGNLDLRLVRFQLAGGDSGPALVPGNPDESLIVQRIRSGEMPPGKGKVSEGEIAKLEEWIRGGAQTKAPEPETIPDGLGVSMEDRQWWSFQPIRRPAIDLPLKNSRVRSPIDALVAASLPEEVTLSADAQSEVVLKRMSFDLVGLPPTQDEIDRFLSDHAPDAVERLGDRLLASPRYGERWARHWLDVVGYADSEGGTPQDAIRPYAYRYRDYVIDSLNRGVPFDQFIEEQLAGDELAGPIVGDLSPRQIELLTATGFLRMAADGTGTGDNTPEARQQVVADTIKIVTTSLLGLSVACAQCHDHRYDPILQRDYYSLRAVLDPALDCTNWKPPQARLISLYTAANRRQAAEIEAEAQKVAAERQARQDKYLAEASQKELNKFDEPLRAQLRKALDTPADKRSDEQKLILDQNPSVNISPGVLYQYNAAAAEDLQKMDQRIAEIRSTKPTEEFVQALVEPTGLWPTTHRLHRGDYRQPLEAVSPAAPTVLTPENQQVLFSGHEEKFSTSGRRRALAQWLVGPENPLTARVLANRFWMHHFGNGLVTTAADFGRLGTPPTQPALLDWLADELLSSGWDLKRFHREVIASTVYRQSSAHDPTLTSRDPENRLLARRSLQRLDAETLRDRVLEASGSLEPSMHGPADPLAVDDSGQVIIDGSHRRRTIYTTQRRSQPVALLQAFDAPVMQTNCEARSPSTVATQSLMLMNGSFILDQSALIADRARREPAKELPAELASGIAAIGGGSASPIWQFGYGTAEAGAEGETRFTPLPHWTGSTWQGDAQLPSAGTGWVMLSAHGGHPGKNPEFAAVRRWTAPKAGTVTIGGALQHPSENGDGVRGRAILNRRDVVGEWMAEHGTVETKAPALEVNKGDTIDFVLDCREHETSDSFDWRLVVTQSDEGRSREYSSVDGFHGPVTAGDSITAEEVTRVWELCYRRRPTRRELESSVQFLSEHLEELRSDPSRTPAGRSPEGQSLTHLAQVLLNSNEFLYVE